MKFELCKIDPNNCTVAELEKEINRLNGIKEEYHNQEQSIKIFINSIYGACASPYFVGYNTEVAEAVTLQGQDIIFYTNKIMDGYFKDQWHLDKEAHKKLGLNNVNQIMAKSLVIYNDTDSIYLTFKPVLDSCDWKENYKNEVDFIEALNKIRIQGFIKECFDRYAEKFNSKNLQDLEMETISYTGLFMAKKKYILDKAWTDTGVRYAPQEKIKPVGVELVQSSTPKFAREAQKEMLHLLLAKGKDIKYQEIIAKLREYKKKFKLQNPDDIGISKGIGDYEKSVIEDKTNITLAKGCPIHVRAAAVYNNGLLNSKYKSKYSLLKTGDKCKYYYAKGAQNVYGFVPGNYPVEFASEVDYDMQFEKILVEPTNRYIETMGFNAVPGHLMFSTALF